MIILHKCEHCRKNCEPSELLLFLQSSNYFLFPEIYSMLESGIQSEMKKLLRDLLNGQPSSLNFHLAEQ